TDFGQESQLLSTEVHLALLPSLLPFRLFRQESSGEQRMARKRSNAEGSVYFSERDQRWEASLVVGRKPDGRLIRRKFTGKTRKAVTAKLDAAKAALDHGLDVPDNRTTVADFAAWWLAHVLPAEGLTPATELWYRDMLT